MIDLVSEYDVFEDVYVDSEDDIQNLFVLLDKLPKIEFEDKIVQLAGAITKNISNIDSPIFRKMGLKLIDLLKKNDFVISDFFDFIFYMCYNNC